MSKMYKYNSTDKKIDSVELYVRVASSTKTGNLISAAILAQFYILGKIGKP